MFQRSLLALFFLPIGLGQTQAQPNNDPPKGEPKAKIEQLNLVITGQLLDADAVDPARGKPAKVHAVKMRKGQSYTIDLVSTDFDAYLRLEDSANKQLAEDDDGGGNLNSRIQFTADKDDTYLIYASHLGGGEGGYTLSVKSYAPVPVKVLPVPAPTPKMPGEIQAQLVATDPPSPVRNRPGKTHAVDLKKGVSYVIDLISPNFDCYLILQDARGVVLAQDDDGGENLNSRIRFTPPENGSFRLIATTFNGQVGGYTLRVTQE
ncbi:MAG: PPC domain-containing protein [Planctomycetota bacterium]